MSANPEYIDRSAGLEADRILVIDDDPDFAEGMDLLLTPEGYKVELAHSAAEASSRIVDFPADVALIDIRLSSSSGISLIRTLKRQNPNILCVMMTAYASTDTAIEALREGAYGYLVKPFGGDELLLTVQRCFERLNLEKEKAAVGAALRSRNRDVEEALEELEKSERRYRSLVETCPICIKEIDLSGKLMNMNSAGLAMMGVDDIGEIQGVDYFDLIDTADRSVIRALFAKACDGHACNFEWVGFLNARPRALATSFTPLLARDGAVSRIMSITQDITDQKAAEQFLRDENIYLREKIRLVHSFDEIIGQSEQLRKVLAAVEKVAPTDVSVLILGETGTGKELIARALHNLSARRNKPMVSVNCPALPAELIESELFGHEAGAFTGAQSQRKGRFELADGGTIFLDELAELPLVLQSKLLRVLQTGEFERLGGTQTLHSDVRLIAATNNDLKKSVENGSFRADLYYRVSSFPVKLPPLRDRKGDIPLLAEHFVHKHAKRLGKEVDAISSSMMKELIAFSWPGNIRELESVIERALISSGGHPVLTLSGPLQPRGRIPVSAVAGVFPSGEETDLSTVERAHIIKVLEESMWKISGKNGAAAVLNVPPSTLRSKMKRLGISREKH